MSTVMKISGPNPQEIANQFHKEMELVFGGKQHRVKAKCMHLANLVMHYPQTFPFVGIAPAASPNSFFIIPKTLAAFLKLKTNSLNSNFRIWKCHHQRLNKLTRHLISQNNPNFLQFLNLPGISLITLPEPPSIEEETQPIESHENQTTTFDLEPFREQTEEYPSNDISMVLTPFIEENDYGWWNPDVCLEPINTFGFD